MAMTTPPKMIDGVNELSDSPRPPCRPASAPQVGEGM